VVAAEAAEDDVVGVDQRESGPEELERRRYGGCAELRERRRPELVQVVRDRQVGGVVDELVTGQVEHRHRAASSSRRT
jgi:hypothetical protein